MRYCNKQNQHRIFYKFFYKYRECLILLTAVSVLNMPSYAEPINPAFLSVDLNGQNGATGSGWQGWNFGSPAGSAGTPVSRAFGDYSVKITAIGTSFDSRDRGGSTAEPLQDFIFAGRDTAIGLGRHYLVFEFTGLNPNAQYELTFLTYDAYHKKTVSFMAFDTRNPSLYSYGNGENNYQPVAGGINDNYEPGVNGSTNPFYGTLLGRSTIWGPSLTSIYQYSSSFFAVADSNGKITIYAWNDSDTYVEAQLVSMVNGFELGLPDYIWNGSSSGIWTDAGNWSGGTAPVDGSSIYDRLVFGDGGAGELNITGADGVYSKIEGIDFSNAPGGYSISGTGSFSIEQGGTIEGDSGFAHIINVNLVSNDSGGIVFSDSDDITINGIISTGVAGGGITKSGTGTLTLNGDNTYTGGTYLSGGTILLGHDNALSLGGLSITGDGHIQSNDNSRLIGNAININNNTTLTVSGSQDLTLSGIISGAGALNKDGAGTLMLSGVNNYSGGTTVTSGTLIGDTDSLQGDIVNNCEVVFEQNNDGIYADVMSGTGNMTKIGSGVLLLSGNNTYTGTTTVADGTLNLTGQLWGDVIVDGGIFVGSGIIANGGSLWVKSESRVLAGNSIGTIIVSGDYTQDTGSVLEIEVIKYSDGTLGNDKIEAAGSVLLEPASTISVIDLTPPDRFIGTGDKFTIITAQEGITDEGVIIDSTAGTLLFKGSIVGNDYILTAFRDAFGKYGVGKNNTSLLRAIDMDMGSARGDYVDVINILTDFDKRSLNIAAEQLSPLSYSAVSGVSSRLTRDLHADMSSYLNKRRNNIEQASRFGVLGKGSLLLADASTNPDTLAYVISETEKRRTSEEIPDMQTNTFIRPFGVFFNQDSSPKFTGFQAQTAGVQFGIDRVFRSNWLLGIGGSYSHSCLDYNKGLGRAKIDSFRVGPYMSYYSGRFYIDSSVSFGYHLNSTERNIEFAGINRTAEGNYSAYDLSLYTSAGYEIDFDKWTLTPSVSLQYTCYRSQSFKETGAGDLGLKVDSDTQKSLLSRMGLRLHTITELAGMKLVPEFFVGYAHEFMNEKDIHARFTGGVTKFSTDIDSGRKNSVYFGAGLSTLLKENISAFVSYEGEAYSGGGANALRTGLTIKF